MQLNVRDCQRYVQQQSKDGRNDARFVGSNDRGLRWTIQCNFGNQITIKSAKIPWNFGRTLSDVLQPSPMINMIREYYVGGCTCYTNCIWRLKDQWHRKDKSKGFSCDFN